MRREKPGESKTKHHRETPAFSRLNKALARRIRELRSQKGWTIEQTAERIQIEPSHVKRIEAADANPTLAVLLSIARGFGIKLSELIADAEA